MCKIYCIYLPEHFLFEQNPKDADPMMKVQSELDETKVIVVCKPLFLCSLPPNKIQIFFRAAFQLLCTIKTCFDFYYSFLFWICVLDCGIFSLDFLISCLSACSFPCCRQKYPLSLCHFITNGDTGSMAYTFFFVFSIIP